MLRKPQPRPYEAMWSNELRDELHKRDATIAQQREWLAAFRAFAIADRANEAFKLHPDYGVLGLPSMAAEWDRLTESLDAARAAIPAEAMEGE